MSAMELPDEDPRALSDESWGWVSRHMPIPCVDVLPVVRSPGGWITHVGLIRRTLQDRVVWCQVGGRLLYEETLQQGADRHLATTLRTEKPLAVASDPYFVNQYFPEGIVGFGKDPRKHAVAVCYLAEAASEAPIRGTGEALSFSWFEVDHLPADADLWPGTKLMLEALPWHNPDLSYESLNARYLSHNELMWQTPVLAMTAMAFLMTIALGNGEAWARAVASMLSFMTALVSVQLMTKHSYFQIEDADQLWSLEKRLHMLPVHAPPAPPSGKPLRGRLVSRTLMRLENWMVRWRSRQWWMVAMMLFGVVSLVVGVIATVSMIV